ncbi:MAG: hypothetical protein CMM76_11070 [Rhodospirillaceae bacterium]|nr:hypothetical protein [Rhodospirillaceae bacterium]|tara:strand:+ start:70 stop:978 length:909 start_codon:yes stop_codon:yes gene_type:complete
MLDLWVWITLFAVVMQVIRHGLQKHLTATMKPMGVVWVRFLFGLPFGILYFGLLLFHFETDLPPTTVLFWVFCLGGALTQIGGTFCLILLFSERNFAVGITYTKTEIIQATVFGLALVGDVVTPAGYVAIFLSMVGVMVLSAKGGDFNVKNLITGIASRAALLGIASGMGFASASVFIRGAALELGEDGFLLRAGYVLVIVLTMEAVLMAIYFLCKDRTEIANIFRQWKPSLLVGFTSALGSVGWFSAMTLERVAYVKTVSQLEVIFSILISYIIFKERSRLHELFGMALVMGGIVVLLLWA